MTGDRKTTTTSEDAYEALVKHKREDESMSDLFERAAAALEAHDPITDSSPASAEMPDDLLREAHIEDIANTVASRTATELQEQMPRH
jgi:hypothetical protein